MRLLACGDGSFLFPRSPLIRASFSARTEAPVCRSVIHSDMEYPIRSGWSRCSGSGGKAEKRGDETKTAGDISRRTVARIKGIGLYFVSTVKVQWVDFFRNRRKK